MPLQIIHVDTFTTRPFAGNPAAVCVLDDQPAEWWLQDVAREINLSATAFLAGHDAGYDLRWFSPQRELDLCGHGTLASAHVLWESGRVPDDSAIRFHTREATLDASRDGEVIEIALPQDPPTEVEIPDALNRLLGATAQWVGRSQRDLLVELGDEKAVRTFIPDATMLSTLGARGLIVTAPAISQRFDFVSRFFSSHLGDLEDPVTGSAHCTLGPFWSDRLGRTDLVGYQVSDRGGEVRVRLRDRNAVIGGSAVTVMRGTLLV